MRRCCFMGCCSIAMLAIALLSSGAAGQSPTGDQTNAATWYRRAIERYNALPPEQRDAILNHNWGQSPSPEVRALLNDANVRAALDDFHRAAAFPTCDFNLDRSMGFDLLLPHLAPMRGLARIARADFDAALADGDSAAITQHLQSLYRSSGQVGHDDILISALVGTAIFSMTDTMAQNAIDAAALSPEASAAIVSAMESLDADDPFGYVDAIIGEREMGLTTIHNYLDSNNPEELAAFLGVDAAKFPTDEASINRGIEEYDAFMNRAIEIFSIDDAQAAQEALNELDAQLESRIETGEATPLMMLAPAIGKALEVRHRTEDALADRRRQLKQLASGQVKPEDLANAAVWYRRAIALLDSIEPSQLAAMCVAAAEPGAPLDPQVIEMMAQPAAQRAIEMLHTASLFKRCQFFSTNPYEIWPRCALIPDHMPGMHQAMCLLLADGLRLQAAGESNAAADRIAVCTRVAAHLTAEPHLTGSLIAHTAMSRAARILTGIFAAGSIEQDTIKALGYAWQRHDPLDAFRYNAATLAAREWYIKMYIGPLDVRDADVRKRRDADAREVNRLTADQLLYCMALGWEQNRLSALRMQAEREHEQEIERERQAAAAATEPAATQPAATQTAAAPPSQPAQALHPLPTVPCDPCLWLGDVFATDALALVRQEAAEPPTSPLPWRVLASRKAPLPLIAGEGGIDGRILAAQDIRARIERLLNDASALRASD